MKRSGSAKPNLALHDGEVRGGPRGTMQYRTARPGLPLQNASSGAANQTYEEADGSERHGRSAQLKSAAKAGQFVVVVVELRGGAESPPDRGVTAVVVAGQSRNCFAGRVTLGNLAALSCI